MSLSFGIDFGTTNSVVALAGPEGVQLRRADTSSVFRSILCFQGSARDHVAGPDAALAYLDDPPGCRLMMSLKSHLAQPGLDRSVVFGRPVALEDLVATFLGHLFRATGVPPGAAITAGRPVRFAGSRADAALGEARLREAFARAGAGEVRLALEPEAAGHRFAQRLTRPATVLIGDFGGGTSDFSVLRFAPGRPAEALSHSGVGIAGDAFDAAILRHAVTPLLGRDGQYRPFDQWLPVPGGFFSAFARWHHLAQMRTPRTLRDIAEVARTSDVPGELGHLVRLIDDEQGLALYRAVSDAKATLSSEPEAKLSFHHRELAIEQVITRTEFESWIAPDVARIAACVDAALAEAQLPDERIDHVFLTGGSASVPAVRRIFETRFGQGRLEGGGEFTSVAEGLAAMALAA